MKSLRMIIVLFVAFVLCGCAGFRAIFVTFTNEPKGLTPNEVYVYYKSKAEESKSIVDYAYKVIDNERLKSHENAIVVKYYYSNSGGYAEADKGDRVFRAYCDVKYLTSAGDGSKDSFCAQHISRTSVSYINNINYSDHELAYTEHTLKEAIEKAKAHTLGYTLDTTPAPNVKMQYVVSTDLKGLTRVTQNNSNSPYTYDLANIGNFIYRNSTYGIVYKSIPQTDEAEKSVRQQCAVSGNTVLVNPGTTCEVAITIDVVGLSIAPNETFSLGLSGGVFPFTVDNLYTRDKARYDELAKKSGL